jgi:hypothetical protein
MDLKARLRGLLVDVVSWIWALGGWFLSVLRWRGGKGDGPFFEEIYLEGR